MGGLSTGSSPRSSKHIEVIQDLIKMEDEYPKPAAAICYMDEEECGYLFEIVTAKGQPYKVTFDNSGFVLDTDIHFNSMTSLLDHMTTVVKVSLSYSTGPVHEHDGCNKREKEETSGDKWRSTQSQTVHTD